MTNALNTVILTDMDPTGTTLIGEYLPVPTSGDIVGTFRGTAEGLSNIVLMTG